MKKRVESRWGRRVMVGVLAASGTGLFSGAAASADVLREHFDTGIPSSWTLEDYLSGEGAAGSGIAWGVTSAETYENYTGGDGLAAMADSDSAGDGVEYDIGLLTPWVRLTDEAGLTLSFRSNYQNFAASDFADVDVRTVGGEWVNILRWNEDHGDSFHNAVGEVVTLGLDDFAGHDVQFRFHYYDLNENDWNWYWQVDDVVVTPTPGVGAVGLMGIGAALRRRRR